MRSRKRRYIWVSLLLTGILSVPGKTMAWSGGWTEDFTDISGNMLSANESDGVEISHDELVVQMGSVSDDIADRGMLFEDKMSGMEDEVLSENVSENEMPGMEDGTPSENVSETSGNSLSEDFVRREESTDPQNRTADVVLPTEIPFDIIFWGEEKREAWIRSDQYYIENKGYEDVCISVYGSVSLNGDVEDYVFVNSTTEEVSVEDKKNVWVYLKWEDEERGAADHPEIVMGDVSDPGKGEIVLKAPERNEEGEIVGDNPGSKAYFSFAGDIKSEMDQGWESKELEVDLSFSINELEGEVQDLEMRRNEYVPAGPNDMKEGFHS